MTDLLVQEVIVRRPDVRPFADRLSRRPSFSAGPASTLLVNFDYGDILVTLQLGLTGAAVVFVSSDADDFERVRKMFADEALALLDARGHFASPTA